MDWYFYRTSLMKSNLLAILLALGALSPVSAQNNRGAITGRVLDSSGAILQGAQVQLQPKAVTAGSDERGEFLFTDLAAGDYKVSVSYVGFDAYEQDVKLDAGETKTLEIQVKVTSQTDSIIVTSDRPRGEAEAINRTRMADNILQVIPADVIRSLPNANIADAL